MTNKRLRRVLVWAPRVLGLLGVLLLSLLAFDVFEMEGAFWQLAGAFLLHLVPAGLVLLAVALGWRWPWVGGLLFLALGVLYVWVFRPDPWSWDLLLPGPVFLTGLLFLLGWLTREQRGLQP